MKKVYSILLLFLVFMSKDSFAHNLDHNKVSDSTKVEYSVFIIKEKSNWYCSSEKSLIIRNFGNNLSKELYQKITKKISEKLKTKENQTVINKSFTVANGSWIIIYEGTYKFDDCEYKRNHVLITNNYDGINQEIQNQINSSFISEHYSSHTIVFSEQVKLEEPSYLEKINKFFKDVLENIELLEKEKLEVRESAGVRG